MENQTTAPDPFSIERMQLALYDHLFYQGWRFWLFNTFYFKWESDCLAFNDKGQTVEVEIKRSRSDFKNDFAKHKHSSFRCRFTTEQRIPSKFYFACPAGLIQPDELPDYAGLIYIHDLSKGLVVKIVKPAFTLTYETANEEDLYMLVERSNQKMMQAWRQIGRV